jgi:Cu-processing system permease protein
MRALSVAHNTFREARRDRVQWVLLVYVVILVGGSMVLTPLSMGEGYRITRDLGLAAMSLVGLLLIAMVGGGMVHKEIERRTVLAILAKPLRRSDFLFGKFLGLLAMVAMVFVGMALFLALVLAVIQKQIDTPVLVAAAMTFGELMILTAVVTASSAFLVSPTMSAFTALAVFVCGNFAESLMKFAESAPAGIVSTMSKAAYYVVPHFHLFNWRAEAAYGISAGTADWVWASLYAILYSMAILAVGAYLFSRREFR